ncbi:UNVERIFIED_CONTAM: hypothetical protein FKN15_013166 [Acipenser sinensis]
MGPPQIANCSRLSTADMLNKTPAGSLLTTIACLVPEKRKLVTDELFPQAIDYLQKAFQVRKQAGPVLLSRQCATNQYLRKKDDPHRYCQGACAETTRCGPVIVPEQHLQQCKVCSENGKSCGPAGEPDGAGLQDADFVLYVSGLTTERCGQENIVAYAAYCQLEAALDRPIAGYANLCPNMISTQPQEFIGMLSTVKHEIIHALEEARKHFDCPILEGMELENQGGLGTELNHWEKRLLENEAMTGSHTQNRVFSRITLAIMEDTGWYRANYSMAERLDWGRGMGCDFVMKSCKFWMDKQRHTWYRANYSMAERLDWGRGMGCDFVMKSCKFWMDKQRHTKQKAAPFCDALRSNPLQLTCRQDNMAVAVCNLQKYMKNIPAEYQYFDGIPGIPFQDLPYYGGSVEIADYCPFNQEFSWHLSGEFQRSSNCRIAENQPDQSRNYGAEKYGPDSVCLLQGSAFVMEQCTRRMAYPDWGSGCYKISCSSQGLTVWIQDNAYLCSRAGQLLIINVEMSGWVYTGSLVCPSCFDFCRSCPPERDPPPFNKSRRIPIDPCSSSSSLVVTLWLLLINLIPLLAGFLLCAWN